MNSPPATPSASPLTLTFHAYEGTPFRHESLANMVSATMRGLAEKHAMEIAELTVTADSITIHLVGTDSANCALFEQDFRRMTTGWYRHRFGVPVLWADPDE